MGEQKNTATKQTKVTPLMKQYNAVKAKHPEAVLLFRVGDFYETFGADAITVSKILGIVLTNRNNGGSKIELAGFPYHSLDTYLPKLVRAGFRVAICEQLEKPSKEKKIVRRGVTEIVTPGVVFSDQILENKSNNFLATVHFGSKGQHGIAFLDFSTGEFLVDEGPKDYIDKLLQSFAPAEVLFSRRNRETFEQQFGQGHYTFTLDEWAFQYDYARERLLDQFAVASLKGFGIEEMKLAQVAAGAALHYLATTENKDLGHLNRITRIEQDRYVWLDRFTIRNLELIQSSSVGGTALIDVLDRTVTPMGGRLLKKWVLLPLKVKTEIDTRLDTVQFYFDHPDFGDQIERFLMQMGDLERLISKVAMSKINPREVKQLERALHATEPLKNMLAESGQPHLMTLGEGINPCVLLRETIEKSLVEDPPVNLNKGGVIADDYDPELDDLRNIIRNSQQLLLELQQREIEKTGITNLKIGFNNVFGYYLEVTRKHKDLAPEEWTRKQTLTNAERYITEELKVLEDKILNAEEKILALETGLFEALVLKLNEYIQPVQHNAHIVARIDCLLGFARIAAKSDYRRASINETLIIDIKGGRHPVIEQQLNLGESYIPNDVYLDNENEQVLMITGPNMSGKSALLRQTALISLLGQMGSFVPATTADLGIIDKVFTRVGASDNISSGESTFMVEMNETASIMNNISERSLILLDEIGRGTSTYDGISIAWSIAEFLHNNNIGRPKTLFATHYHELNDLAKSLERIKNYHVSTREVDQKVIFLRKLVPGGSEHSFGIHVARMAGMPKSIVHRASQILEQLEAKALNPTETDETDNTGQPSVKRPAVQGIEQPIQLSIFETADPSIGKIRELLIDMDVNSMTPVDCLVRLNELKKLAKESME